MRRGVSLEKGEKTAVRGKKRQTKSDQVNVSLSRAVYLSRVVSVPVGLSLSLGLSPSL